MYEINAPYRFGPDCQLIKCTAQRKHGKGPCHQPATKLSVSRGRPLCQTHGGSVGRDRSKLSATYKARQASFHLKGFIDKTDEPTKDL